MRARDGTARHGTARRGCPLLRMRDAKHWLRAARSASAPLFTRASRPLCEFHDGWRRLRLAACRLPHTVCYLLCAHRARVRRVPTNKTHPRSLPFRMRPFLRHGRGEGEDGAARPLLSCAVEKTSKPKDVIEVSRKCCSMGEHCHTSLLGYNRGRKSRGAFFLPRRVPQTVVTAQN